MSAEIATILGLGVMFVVATALPINMGALGFAAAFLIGTLFGGMTARRHLRGLPRRPLRHAGRHHLPLRHRPEQRHDRLAGAPGRAGWWAGGSRRSPGSCSRRRAADRDRRGQPGGLRHPRAHRPALRRPYRINPLLMGLMVIHGAQGGGFSPISIYGGITNQVVDAFRPAGRRDLALPRQPGLQPVVGVVRLLRLRRPAAAAARSARRRVAAGPRRLGAGARAMAAAPSRDRPRSRAARLASRAASTREQIATLLGLAALAVGALASSLMSAWWR